MAGMVIIGKQHLTKLAAQTRFQLIGARRQGGALKAHSPPFIPYRMQQSRYFT